MQWEAAFDWGGCVTCNGRLLLIGWLCGMQWEAAVDWAVVWYAMEGWI